MPRVPQQSVLNIKKTLVSETQICFLYTRKKTQTNKYKHCHTKREQSQDETKYRKKKQYFKIFMKVKNLFFKYNLFPLSFFFFFFP